MTAVELVRQLHLEADELRKQKKRQNVTGLHKSVPQMTPLYSISLVIFNADWIKGYLCVNIS